MTDTVTVSSVLHGDRLWRRAAERDHMTRDGRQVRLAVWKTRCVMCANEFEIATTTAVIVG